ncbi:biotin carboxylase N-terminal domain-containing protein [Lipingzhangella halophila]|uniref:biotin carboxylase N-terminal domain-containing protein n=1 Tax=Lipingzhangella halophila TaxID=1783352 RepID=UPI0028AECD97|nr:biotin carboxylase N-terminal domain-containing protein [Lipingzhangella halophila]
MLIANRGEIAVRIHRAAAALGLRTVAVFAPEDRDSLHVRLADDAHPLDGAGAAAYLDSDQLTDVALRAGCSLVHQIFLRGPPALAGGGIRVPAQRDKGSRTAARRPGVHHRPRHVDLWRLYTVRVSVTRKSRRLAGGVRSFQLCGRRTSPRRSVP